MLDRICVISSHILVTSYGSAAESKQTVFRLGYGVRGQDLDGRHGGHVLHVTVHTHNHMELANA